MPTPAGFKTPTVSIYQDSTHIEGMLQQLRNMGLVTSSTRDLQSAFKEIKDRRSEGKGSGSGKLKLPWVGEAGVDISGSLARALTDETNEEDSASHTYSYSDAFYLHVIRADLRAKNLLTSISTDSTARQLKPGDLVEFQAHFVPNRLAVLLDILTPELISEITFRSTRIKGLNSINWSAGDIDTRRQQMEQNLYRAETEARMARSIAESMLADFRSPKTREYYGEIKLTDTSTAVTAVTICDSIHFLTEDEDRILDGDFTVMGKVVSMPVIDKPTLARNKLLSYLKPEFVDEVMEWVSTTLSSVTSGSATATSALQQNPLEVVLPSRIKGRSFQVLPLAIYS